MRRVYRSRSGRETGTEEDTGQFGTSGITRSDFSTITQISAENGAGGADAIGII